MFSVDTIGAKALAGLCAFGGVFVAMYQIVMHLRFYSEPMYQRYIVRIVFMVPVYAVASFLSLVNPANSIWFNSVREVYEAWVIYNFLALLLAYVGGPGAVEVKMNGYVLAPSVGYCTCCMPPLPVNGMFVKTTKRMALQFVLLKPLLTGIGLVLHTTGHYEEGNWAPNSWYLWQTMLNNIIYSTALYGMVLFYQGCHDLLAPYKPLLKFVLIKAVIFVTFWQGLVLAILSSLGVLPPEIDSGALQNFLMCCEILPAAVFMLFAFPWGIYSVAGQATGLKTGAVSHAMSIGDVVTDTLHHFAPEYRDYVLYSDGQHNGAGARGRGGSHQASTRSKTRVGKDNVERQQPMHQDKATLLMHMEMGSRWRTTEEGVVTATDFARLGRPSETTYMDMAPVEPLVSTGDDIEMVVPMHSGVRLMTATTSSSSHEAGVGGAAWTSGLAEAAPGPSDAPVPAVMDAFGDGCGGAVAASPGGSPADGGAKGSGGGGSPPPTIGGAGAGRAVRPGSSGSSSAGSPATLGSKVS